MGARARTRAKLNVRPRPLVVNATDAVQKNNTPVDPKPRTPNQEPRQSPNALNSPTHAIELATLQRSLLNAVSHLLFPTSLFLSVLLHVFALFSSLGMKILLNAFPLSSSSTPRLFYLHRFLFRVSVFNSSCLLLLFLLSSLYLQWLSPRVCHAFPSSRLCFSLPQFPLSPSFLPNVTDALAVAPALCAPARVARAIASDFHANLNVAAGVVSGTLTACGSTLLAVWGALPKRRGNASSDSELPYHQNTFIEVRWVCVFASSLTLTLTLTHTLCAINPTLPSHNRTRVSCPPSPLSRSLSFFSLLFFVFVFAFSSSSSYLLPLCTSFLLLFFTPASSSSYCFFSS